MRYDLFISHASADRAVAEGICRHLETRGVRCWLAPRDIAPGASWGAAIVKGIASSRAMIVIVSAQAQKSQQVAREVERGVARQMSLMPLRIDDQPLSNALEYFLSQSQWLNAFPGAIDEHFGRIAHAVKNCLQESESRSQVDPPPAREEVPQKPPGGNIERVHPDRWGRKRQGGFFDRLSALFDDQ